MWPALVCDGGDACRPGQTAAASHCSRQAAAAVWGRSEDMTSIEECYHSCSALQASGRRQPCWEGGWCRRPSVRSLEVAASTCHIIPLTALFSAQLQQYLFRGLQRYTEKVFASTPVVACSGGAGAAAHASDSQAQDFASTAPPLPSFSHKFRPPIPAFISSNRAAREQRPASLGWHAKRSPKLSERPCSR